MARLTYPSDEARRKNKPAVRVHHSIENHPRMAAVYADNDLLAAWTRIMVAASKAHAGKTGNRLTFASSVAASYGGRRSAFQGRQVVGRLCITLGWLLEESETSITIEIRNFARKQGFDYAPCVVGPELHSATPAPSESESESESEIKKEEDVVTSSPAFRENAEPPTTTPSNGGSAPPIPEPQLDPELRAALEATTWLQALIQPATTSWWSKLLTLYEPVAELYVFDELAKADLWLEAHPDRRPRSLRGQQQFVANWLRRSEADAHKLAAGIAAVRRTYGSQPQGR